MRIVLCALMLTAVATALCAAGTPADSAKTFPVTGNVSLDLFGLRDLAPGPRLAGLQQTAPAALDGRKSPWLAAGLSLALPGAGEFYTESYWKSALFLAVEVGAWALAYSYDKRGDRGTDDFNNFADTHWSVLRYIQYTQANFVATSARYDIWKFGTPPPATAANTWDYVNWNELNRMEHDAATSPNGSFYSHTLPPHGDQQYYEEVGKYEQYNSGWDDVSPNLPPDYATIKANESANGLSYMYQRSQVNTYYKRASTFVSVAIINHLVSAVDAALSAGWFNKRIQAQMGVQTVPDKGGSYTQVPVVKLAYRL